MQTVRFGVVGLGIMGDNHLKTFAGLKDATLTAVCDTKPERVEKFAPQYNVKGFTDYREMLNSGLIDAILIATPHYDHGKITLDAFEKNIHVLCEKPMTVSISEARKVIAAHRERYSHLTFALDLTFRSGGNWQSMRNFIAEGHLGKIQRITFVITEWFRSWAYYASGGWRATWAGEGGGVLLNQAPHSLDLLQWIPGMMPKRVTAVAFLAKQHPIEVEDEVSAILEYDNGAIGHFITTTGETPGSNRFEIAGDKGLLWSEGDQVKFRQLKKSVKWLLEDTPELFPKKESELVDIPMIDSKQNHAALTQDFINNIVHKTPLLAPGEDGAASLELGNAMLMIGVTRKPVELPVDSAAYDAFLQELTKRYGGNKKVLGINQNWG